MADKNETCCQHTEIPPSGGTVQMLHRLAGQFSATQQALLVNGQAAVTEDCACANELADHRAAKTGGSFSCPPSGEATIAAPGQSCLRVNGKRVATLAATIKTCSTSPEQPAQQTICLSRTPRLFVNGRAVFTAR